jgi:hypothetical protein
VLHLVQITNQLANPDPCSQLDLCEPALRFVVIALLAVFLQRLGLVVISRTSSNTCALLKHCLHFAVFRQG